MHNTHSPHSQKIHDFAFPDGTSREIFETWLSKMDHITPLFCEPGELADKTFDLIANGEGKYTLKIDKTITKPQVYNMIQSLEKDLGLTRFKTFEKVQNRVKMLVGVLLERGDMTEEQLKNTIQKSGVILEEGEFENFRNKKYSREDKIDLKNFLFRANKTFEELEAMSPEKFKAYVQSKKGHFNVLKNKDTQAIIDMIFQAVLHGLDALFFARGKDELARNMMTITMGEIEEIDRKVESGEIKKGQVAFDTKENISHIEKKLREDIGVDELKKKLEEVRKTGDKEQIEKMEIGCANKILQCLKKYPWQVTNNHGSFPNLMKIYKEIQCVGFSILGHIFLEELKIAHDGVKEWGHIFVSVLIGGKRYCFDPESALNTVEIMHFHNDNKIYKNFSIVGSNYKNYAYKGETEKFLCASIYHNLGTVYYHLGGEKNLNLAGEYCKKAIFLNPCYVDSYNTLGAVYYHLGGEKNLNLAGEYCKKAIFLHPCYTLAYNNLGCIYREKGGKENLKKSREYYKKAKELSPKKPSMFLKIKKRVKNFFSKLS